MIPLKDNIKGRTFPFVNILLILINAGVFYLELKQSSPKALTNFITAWALIPHHLIVNFAGEWIKIPTSMFLHAGWMHFLGNMLYLWIFGDNVEDRMGHRRYLIFYFLVGSCAALSQVYINHNSTLPLVGASGAIAGVMGAYFVLFPKAKIMALVPIWIFIRFIEIPAILFLGFWFLLQALQSWGSILSASAGGSDIGGVAWWAHAGGFLSGFLFVFIFKKK